MTTTGRRSCMLAIESAFAAPVSCSAIRKSDAVRTPRARPLGMSSVVGLPAPMQSATWSKPMRHRVVERQRAAEAHAAEHREFVAALEQQPDELEEVLVPAHRDAVFGDAAEAGHHAVVERLVEFVDVADRPERRARAVGAHARDVRGERLDLEAVDADDGVAFVEQVVRQREARRAHAGDQHLVAACRLRDEAAGCSADSSA